MNHLEVLRQFNAWRRGAETEMLDPAIIGQAIDAVIGEIELRRRGECICRRCGLRQDGERSKGDF